MEKIHNDEMLRAEREKTMTEDEMKSCTFRPEIKRTGKNSRNRSPEQFYS